MGLEAKNLRVHYRMTDDEYDLLAYEAAKRKLSNGQTARVVVLEALSGFDQKQESILRRFDMQNDLLELLIRITSLGAAAATLPFDDQRSLAELKEKLKNHVHLSSEIGKQLVDQIKKGKY